MFFLGDLFYTSKSERERFNVHVKSSPSAYTFKSTVRLKNVSGSGTSTVYAGGGKRQGGYTSSTSPKDYKYPSQFFTGLSASVASEVFYSNFFHTWLGKDFKFRTTIGRKGNGNQYSGGKYKFGKKVSDIFQFGGYIVSGYSAVDLYFEKKNDEINNYQFFSEEISSLGSNVPLYGTAWSIGWEGGRAITYTSLYQKLTFMFWYNQGVKRWGAPNDLNHVLWDEWLQYRAKYYYKQF